MNAGKTKKILCCSLLLICCIFLMCFSFRLGMKYPLIRPRDFGVYCYDAVFKYVITSDETRLCNLVSIMTNEEAEKVVFHTTGYMHMGWYYDPDNPTVTWSPNSYDFFVWDDRGSLDVFYYDDETWIGPYNIDVKSENGKIKYYLYPDHPDEYYDKLFSGDNIEEAPKFDASIEYPIDRIPEEVLVHIPLLEPIEHKKPELNSGEEFWHYPGT